MIATTFKYADLEPAAKERALEWYRTCETQEWEPSFNDILTCFDLLGIEMRAENIHYSLGYCQGDGAVFTGVWYAANVNLGALMEHAPQDTILHDCGARLMAIVLRYPDGQCSINTRSIGPGLAYQYVDDAITGAYNADDYEITMDANSEKALGSIMDMLGSWIYNELREELEYRTSDEACIEGIEANDYSFDEDGSPA